MQNITRYKDPSDVAGQNSMRVASQRLRNVQPHAFQFTQTQFI